MTGYRRTQRFRRPMKPYFESGRKQSTGSKPIKNSSVFVPRSLSACNKAASSCQAIPCSNEPGPSWSQQRERFDDKKQVLFIEKAITDAEQKRKRTSLVRYGVIARLLASLAATGYALFNSKQRAQEAAESAEKEYATHHRYSPSRSQVELAPTRPDRNKTFRISTKRSIRRSCSRLQELRL